MKDKILNHFNGNYLPFYEKYLSNLKHLKGDEYQSLCCFHDDKNPSLSINVKKGQYYCHGCEAKGDIYKFFGARNGLNGNFQAILKGIANDFGIAEPPKHKIVKTWIYNDADGNPLHRTVRTEPKGFFQEHFKNKKWVRGLGGIEPVVYNLPGWIDKPEVNYAEGEKDSDNLSKLGLPATTSPMGAGKWRNSYNKYFEGKAVNIFADNDDVGRNHAQLVAKALHGTAKSIKIVELPGLREKEDVSGFIAKFNDPEEAAEHLSNIIESTQPYEPPKTISIEDKAREILNAQQPCGTFDISSLPIPFQQYINEQAETTETEPIIIVQSLLATISSMVKKKWYMPEGAYFQNLYPNLWQLSIAQSGDFKTTGLNKGARFAWEKERDVSEMIEALDQDDLNKEDRKKRIKLIRQQSAMLPNRSSAEGLLEYLADGCGGMIICSEFGAWLENLEKTHNRGLKALFTDLYDVPQQYTYLTKGGGHLVVNEPFISINAVSTLTWVKSNVNPKDVSSGFFARFLLYYPPQKISIPPALPVIKQRNFKSHDNIRNIINCIDVKRYELSPIAEEYFDSVHRGLYQIISKESDNTREIIQPYLKRWSPYVLKISMLLQPFIDPESNEISQEAIIGANSIVDYAIKSTTYLFRTQLGESEQQSKQRKVLEYIAKHNGKVSRRKLHQSNILDGGCADYDYQCDSLESAGKIKTIKPDEDKKITWEYKLDAENN